MNGKVAKTIRKMARKEAEKEMQILHAVLKPKPKYFPRWLWRTLSKLFFQTGVILNK